MDAGAGPTGTQGKLAASVVGSEYRPPSKQPRIREIDGIRAFAVLIVMLGHLMSTTPQLTHTPDGLPHPLSVLFDHGWLGVDIFFLLSGMLITTILLAARNRGVREYFGYFYERRALRIWPLYFLVLAVLAVCYSRITGVTYVWLCLAFAANFAPLFHVAVPNGAGPLWSLAVEEQFYLIWPVLVLLLPRRALVGVLTAIVLVVPVLRMQHPGAMQYTWFRCDGLAWGALLAIWFTSSRRSVQNDNRLAVGLVALAVTAFLVTIPFGGLHFSPLGSATRIGEVVCVFAALLVFAVSRSGKPETAFLRLPFALLTADFSYCLYLVHVPLIDLYQTAVHRFAPQLPTVVGPLGANVLRAAVVLVAAYAVAALSRRYIELPFLTMGRRKAAGAPIPTVAGLDRSPAPAPATAGS